MTLPDLLDDLAGSAPPPPAGLAQGAWADGRRRRAGGRVRTLVAAAAALALLALVAPVVPADLPVPQVARSSPPAVDGHPERVGRQWWVRGMPDRPGPVAAVLHAYEESSEQWHVVRADGHRWELPAQGLEGNQVAGLSRDGRLLAYLATTSGPYVVRDLVSGRTVEFPEIYGNSTAPQDKPFQVSLQTPVHFSPDGRRLLLHGIPGPLLLDVDSGQVRQVPRLGALAGWAADDELVWIQPTYPPAPPAPARAVVADLEGGVRSEVELPGTEGLSISQWSGGVHVGDRTLAVLSDTSFDGGDGVVRRFSLESGAPVGVPVPTGFSGLCGPAYGPDGTLVVPTGPPEGPFIAQDVTAAALRRFTAVAPEVDAMCLHWAADAIAGPARGAGVLGVEAWGPVWWWKETLLGAVLLGGLVAFLRRKRPVRPREAPPGDRSWFD